MMKLLEIKLLMRSVNKLSQGSSLCYMLIIWEALVSILILIFSL